MRSRRILVTGGCGFIGSHVCSMLLAQGHLVVCADNLDTFYSSDIKLRNISSLQHQDHFVFYRADINHAESLDKLFDQYKFDVVVHLAAKVNVMLSFNQFEEYERVNVAGTQNLLKVMFKHGVPRILFASSSSVYGENPNRAFKETDTLHPLSPYATSKAMAEQLIADFHAKHGLSAIILRLFNVYGSQIRPDLLISKLYQSSLNGTPVKLFNQGNNRKDFTHVSDVCTGISQALSLLCAETPIFETINIGRGNPEYVNNLLHLFEKILGKKITIVFEDQIPGDVSYSCADITLARRKLSFSPNLDLETGLRDTIQFLQTQHQHG